MSKVSRVDAWLIAYALALLVSSMLMLAVLVRIGSGPWMLMLIAGFGLYALFLLVRELRRGWMGADR